MHELGIDLYNMTKALVFSKRNADKVANGDLTRGVVVLGQSRNAIVAASAMDNVVGEGAKRCLKGLDLAAKGNGVGGFVARTALVASDYINPLICASGAVKVALAKDKKTEAINQTSALGGMFLFEKIAKTFLTKKGRTDFLKTDFTKKGGTTFLKTDFTKIGGTDFFKTDFAKNEFTKKAIKSMRKLDAISIVGGKYSKHIKYGVPITKGFLFVGMSILGYTLGSYLGKKINEIRKGPEPEEKIEPKKSEPKTQPNIKQQTAFKSKTPFFKKRWTMASLIGVKPVIKKEINPFMSFNA